MCKTSNGYSFSFMEMINSEGSGKTSATGVVGTVTCLVVLLIFCVKSAQNRLVITLPKQISVSKRYQ